MGKKIPLEKINLLAMFDMVNDLSKSSKKNIAIYSTSRQKCRRKISSVSVEQLENIMYLI